MAGPVMEPMLPKSFLISAVRKETPDTFTFELAPANGGIAPYGPGQFNMLYVFGVGEIPISISGDPRKPQTLAHTTRAVGPVTKAMSRLGRGDSLGVRGPYGTQWPVAEAAGRDVVLVAGGIGLAPLRPAIYHIMANRDHYRNCVLLYGARTPQDILFRKDLAQWRASTDIEIHVTVDRGIPCWRENVGVITTLIPKAPFDKLNTVAMVCGPEVMMRFTVMELLQRGVPPQSIYMSMERNMKCGVGFCGHCQHGPTFICKNGPVFRYDLIEEWFAKREI